MKRVTALLMIIFMCLSLTACGESEEEIIGTWRAEVSAVGEGAPEGECYAYLCFDENGMCTYVVFADDNKLSESAVEYQATSNQLKMIVDSREVTCSYEIKDNEMIISYGGSSQALQRIAYDVVFKAE